MLIEAYIIFGKIKILREIHVHRLRKLFDNRFEDTYYEYTLCVLYEMCRNFISMLFVYFVRICIRRHISN